MGTGYLQASKQPRQLPPFLLGSVMAAVLFSQTNALPAHRVNSEQGVPQVQALVENKWSSRVPLTTSSSIVPRAATTLNVTRSTRQDIKRNPVAGDDLLSLELDKVRAWSTGQRNWRPDTPCAVQRRARAPDRTQEANGISQGNFGHGLLHTPEFSNNRAGPSTVPFVSPTVSHDICPFRELAPAAATDTSTSARSTTLAKVTCLDDVPLARTSCRSPRDTNSSDDDTDTWAEADDVHVHGVGSDTNFVFKVHRNGDLLDDTDIDEFVSKGRLWMTTRSFHRQLRINVSKVTERGLIRKRTYRIYGKVIFYISIPTILVGFVTNFVSLKVFQGLPRNVTNTYVTYLLRFDLVYLLGIVFHCVTIDAFGLYTDSTALLYLYLADKFLVLCLRQLIVCSTALMNIDRYLSVTWPFRKASLAILRRPRALLTVTAFLVLTFNSHSLFKREVYADVFPGTNQTVSYIANTQLYLDNKLLMDWLTIASTCLLQYAPLVAMTAANIALVVSLHRYSRNVSAAYSSFLAESSSASQSSRPSGSGSPGEARQMQENTAPKAGIPPAFFKLEKRMSVTVITYSFVSLLLALPLALLPLLQHLCPAFNLFKREHYLNLTYNKTTYILDIISSSVNFFVFFIIGGAFRFGVRKLVRRYVQSAKTGMLRPRRKPTAWSNQVSQKNGGRDPETVLELTGKKCALRRLETHTEYDKQALDRSGRARVTS